jgi:hypothetical protein
MAILIHTATLKEAMMNHAKGEQIDGKDKAGQK